MKLYLAPLEGLTGYRYRRVFHELFGGMDKYFSPFIAANQSDSFKAKDIQDILPENNPGMTLVPQILTNKADDFIFTSKKIRSIGYDEINLNLGCPSGTVVGKGRGSGFLAKPEELDLFLDQIFTAGVTKISIKTRLGKNDPEEFHRILELYNKYPMEELIIHPRIQKDMYRNTPNLPYFEEAVEKSSNKLCYNGDIVTVDDYKCISEMFPQVDTFMVGRGAIANPGIALDIRDGKKIDKVKVREFHDRLYDEYKQAMSGERNVLYRMKELWFYLSDSFSEPEKYLKKIRKSEGLVDYNAAVNGLFHEKEWIR